MSEVTIRPIEDSDVPVVAELIKTMWVEHGRHARLIDLGKMQAADAVAYIKRHRNKGDVFFVAEADGQVVGAISGMIEELPKYYKYDNMLLLDNLSVALQWRGQGIAGRLIAACEQFAKTSKIQALAGEIWEYNDASRAVFSKQGYGPDLTYWYKVID